MTTRGSRQTSRTQECRARAGPVHGPLAAEPPERGGSLRRRPPRGGALLCHRTAPGRVAAAPALPRVVGKPNEDAIYNGAIDNASGVAPLVSLAGPFAELKVHPRRSIYFAFVAAEEQELIGSAYLVQHPPVPIGRIAPTSTSMASDGLEGHAISR
jgi:Peptidase family M28